VLPRLSIIIPVASGVELLEDTLVSVLENRPESCEVIVVHPGCYDDPYQLGDEVDFLQSPRRAGLVDLANLGISAARGEVVHLLACGALVEEGWTQPALAHFAAADVASVTPLVLDADDPARVAAAGVAYGWGGRRRLIGKGRQSGACDALADRSAGPPLAAAFYRRLALDENAALPRAVGDGFADLELALQLLEMGQRTVFEADCRIRIPAARLEGSGGFLKRGWCAERFFWRHASTRSWAETLLGHSLLAFGELLVDLVRLRMPRLPGRLAATCLARSDLNHHRRAIECELAGTPTRSQTSDDDSEPVTYGLTAERRARDRARRGIDVSAAPTRPLGKAG
jgi:hypothetical protein